MDKLEELNYRLKKVHEAYESMKQAGIDEELLVVWINSKTKLGKASVKEMLKSQEEFYQKLIKKQMLENLKDERS